MPVSISALSKINKKNQVYPETIYNANVRDMDRAEDIEHWLTQKMLREQVIFPYFRTIVLLPQQVFFIQEVLRSVCRAAATMASESR